MIDHNDDSSSEDENFKEALREATDNEFIVNSSFNNNKSPDNSSSEPNSKPSSRYHSGSNRNFESFGVSQSYKEFVGKKLYELLERNIDLSELVNTKTSEEAKKSNGIRLLSSSSKTLICHDEAEPVRTIPTKKQNLHEDSVEDMKKYQEVAVDPEWIIAKTETEMWSTKQKGTVFKYKRMSDGSFRELT